MGYPGLEPGTNRLKAEYSTIELATRLTRTKKLVSLKKQSFSLQTNFETCSIISDILKRLKTCLEIETRLCSLQKKEKYLFFFFCTGFNTKTQQHSQNL